MNITTPHNALYLKTYLIPTVLNMSVVKPHSWYRTLIPHNIIAYLHHKKADISTLIAKEPSLYTWDSEAWLQMKVLGSISGCMNTDLPYIHMDMK